MPYKSKKQQRYMNATHPDIAAEWNQYPIPKYQSSPATIGSPYNYGWDTGASISGDAPVISQEPGQSLIEQSPQYKGMIEADKLSKGELTGTGKVDPSISPFDFIGPGAVRIPSLITKGAKNIYKINPKAVNLNKKIADENLLARQIYGDEALQNFKQSGFWDDANEAFRRRIVQDRYPGTVIVRTGKGTEKAEVVPTMGNSSGSFTEPYFSQGSKWYAPKSGMKKMGKEHVIIPKKGMVAKNLDEFTGKNMWFNYATESNRIINAEKLSSETLNKLAGTRRVPMPSKVTNNPKNYDIYEGDPHWFWGNRIVKKQGGPLPSYKGASTSITGYQGKGPNSGPYIIPSGNITMEGVNFPLVGTDNLGNSKVMTPGNNYTFPGSSVYETPLMKKGGCLPKYQASPSTIYTSDKNDPRIKAYNDSLDWYTHDKDYYTKWLNSINGVQQGFPTYDDLMKNRDAGIYSIEQDGLIFELDQDKDGLSVSDINPPYTIGGVAMGNATHKPTQPVKYANPEIVAKQQTLKDAGLYKGELDGIWGPGSQKAWDKFNNTKEIVPYPNIKEEDIGKVPTWSRNITRIKRPPISIVDKRKKKEPTIKDSIQHIKGTPGQAQHIKYDSLGNKTFIPKHEYERLQNLGKIKVLDPTEFRYGGLLKPNTMKRKKKLPKYQGTGNYISMQDSQMYGALPYMNTPAPGLMPNPEVPMMPYNPNYGVRMMSPEQAAQDQSFSQPMTPRPLSLPTGSPLGRRDIEFTNQQVVGQNKAMPTLPGTMPGASVNNTPLRKQKTPFEVNYNYFEGEEDIIDSPEEWEVLKNYTSDTSGMVGPPTQEEMYPGLGESAGTNLGKGVNLKGLDLKGLGKAAPAILGAGAALLGASQIGKNRNKPTYTNPYAGMWAAQSQARTPKKGPGMDIPTAQSLGFTQSYPSLYAQKGGNIPESKKGFYEYVTDPTTLENVAIPFKNYKKAISSLVPGSIKDFYNYSTDPINLKRAAIPFRNYGRFITGQDEVGEDVDEKGEYYTYRDGGAISNRGDINTKLIESELSRLKPVMPMTYTKTTNTFQPKSKWKVTEEPNELYLSPEGFHTQRYIDNYKSKVEDKTYGGYKDIMGLPGSSGHEFIKAREEEWKYKNRFNNIEKKGGNLPMYQASKSLIEQPATTPTLDIIGEVIPVENVPTRKENRKAIKSTVEAIKNKVEKEGKTITKKQIKKLIKEATSAKMKDGGYLPMYQSSNRSLLEQSADYQGMMDAMRAEEGDITGTGMVEQSISPFDFIGPRAAGNVVKMFTGSPSPILMAGMKGAGKKGITHKGIKGVVKNPKPPTKAEKLAAEKAMLKHWGIKPKVSKAGKATKAVEPEKFIPKYDYNVIKMFEELAKKEAGNLKKGGHLPMYQISNIPLPSAPQGYDTRLQPGSYDANTGKMGYRSTPQQSWDNPNAMNMGDVPMNNPNPNVSSVPNMFMGYGQMPTYQKGGGLSRVKNYGSSSNPYPSVSPGDFAGGGRSYPIPTRADAVDALRLAGLHGRSDVKSKVYAKYPGLKKKKHGGNIHPNAIAEVEAGEVIEEVPGNPTRVLEYGGSVRNSQNYQKMTGNKHSDPEGGPQIAGAEGGFVYSDFLKVPKDIEETLKYLV